MGSHVSDQDEFTVLVTGFGPFREQYPVNPSWEIAKDLPTYLPALRAKDPNARQRDSVEIPKVRILVHPQPIRVNYQVVRKLVPSLWDTTYQGRWVDIAIHIGMAGPRPFYEIENRSHREGYKFADVDGEKLDEEGEKRSGRWVWEGVPEELETDLRLKDVLRRWKGHSSDGMDLRLSQDAGRYMCEFIYFSSLAHLYKQGRRRKVVFLHVPSDASQKTVAQGRELVVNLIRSLVESEVEGGGKEKDGGDDEPGDGDLCGRGQQDVRMKGA